MTDQQLLVAAEKGDIKALQEELSKGVNLVEAVVDEQGKSALIYAAEAGQLVAVKFLIEQQADLDRADNEGRSALHWACETGQTGIVALLLDEAAALNTPDGNGHTALQTAVIWNKPDCIKLLLEREAETTSTAKAGLYEGKTALDIARQRKLSEIVALLTHAAASKQHIHKAAEKGDVKTLQEVLGKGVNVNLADSEGWTALSYAIWYNRLDVVKFLVEQKASLHNVDSSGRSALHSACYLGFDAIAVFLLDKGAAIDTRDNSGQTPLDLASKRHKKSCINLLLARNAGSFSERFEDPEDPDHVDTDLEEEKKDIWRVMNQETSRPSPIHHAAASGNVSDLQNYLTKSLVHVDLPSPKGQPYRQGTPLIIAAARGRAEAVQFLITKRADLLATDEDNRTALANACKGCHADIVHILLKAQNITFERLLDVIPLNQGRDGDVLFVTCRHGTREQIRWLVDNHVDINTRSSAGLTPLLCALDEGWPANQVELLLEHQADIAAVGTRGRLSDSTAFDIADRKSRADVIALMEAHARVKMPLLRLVASAETAFDCSKAGISSLPANISPRIVHLNLNDNQFTEVPACLASLHQLEILNLSQNRISFAPFWLGKLPRLRFLFMAGNPLVGEQLTALNKETGFFAQPDALLTYLRTSEQRVPQRHLLLTVLGHFMVGKTAVVNALAGIKKLPRPDERTVQVTTDVLEDKRSGISFNVRELPGQAQFYGGNRRFLSLRTSVFVVVCRMTDETHREEEEQFRLWLSLLSNHVQRDSSEERLNVRTVLVATHLDAYLKRYPKASKEHLAATWAFPLTLRLQQEYAAVGVQSSSILLVDATNQSETRKAVMSEVRSLGRGLLHERTIPKFMHDVRESWKRGRAKRPPWLNFEAALDAVRSADEKQAFNDRATAEFALGVLIDMGEVVRIGRNIVICDPSWFSRALAVLVLPPGTSFEGIPEGKGKGRMDNGLASAETLCAMLSRRGVVSEQDEKNGFKEALAMLEWLEGLDVLFPLRSAIAQPPLQQLYLIPARLNNTRLPALKFEQKQWLIGRRLLLPPTERFAPGFAAHLACHLWHLDFQLSPLLFARQEMKLVFPTSQALLSLNTSHSELTLIMWGTSAALAVDAPIVLAAVQDALSLLRDGKLEGVQTIALCSSCVRTRELDQVQPVSSDDLKKSTYVCDCQSDPIESELCGVPTAQTAMTPLPPTNVADWCAGCVHAFILDSKPQYADSLYHLTRITELNGKKLLQLKSEEDVLQLGIPLKSRCEAIFRMARELQSSHSEWKDQQEKLRREEWMRAAQMGQQERKEIFDALRKGDQERKQIMTTLLQARKEMEAAVTNLQAQLAVKPDRMEIKSELEILQQKLANNSEQQVAGLRVMLEHLVSLQADAQTAALDEVLSLAGFTTDTASGSASAPSSSSPSTSVKATLQHLLEKQQTAAAANVDELLDTLLNKRTNR